MKNTSTKIGILSLAALAIVAGTVTTRMSAQGIAGPFLALNLANIGTIAHDLLFTDNTYDIGKSGATRPRNLFVAGTGSFGGIVQISNGATGGNILQVTSTGSAATGIQVGNGNAGGFLRVTGASTISLDGSGNAVWITSSNYVATENGANNAIACSTNSGPTLAAGLTVRVKLAHTLQAGANTFAYNGGSALAIVSHRNTASTIAAAYSSGAVIELAYDGTQWEDISQ